MRFFPSFLGTKKTGKVCWELEGRIYPLDSWSSRNASTSFCSSTKRGINWPFFGGKSSFRSIPWSQSFLSGIHLLFNLAIGPESCRVVVGACFMGGIMMVGALPHAEFLIYSLICWAFACCTHLWWWGDVISVCGAFPPELFLAVFFVWAMGGDNE